MQTTAFLDNNAIIRYNICSLIMSIWKKIFEVNIVNKPAIVTIAYNRPDSLKRLLDSLANANYTNVDSDGVTLVISIDKSDTDAVTKLAEEYNWPYGKKVVMARKERMGLKEHVLACGDLTEEYGSIIVLEDDLYVSPEFYDYAVHALDFVEDDERIGGVSLYNHLFNVHARKSFSAIDDGYDNWYFQFASSWGQAYTLQQWREFRKWYSIHREEPIAGAFVPANVAGWSAKSWLKYYITYLIDTNKYFMYPRIGYTTNFGDVGSHAVKADADLQIPVAGRRNSKEYDFATLKESGAVYDAFYENARIAQCVDKMISETCAEDSIDDDVVITDLYGIKPVEEMVKDRKTVRYVLSSRALPYEAIQSYGRQMRPVDANIIYNVAGDDYRLYDVNKSAQPVSIGNKAIEYLYEYRGISAKQMLEILKYRVMEKIHSRK